MCHKGHIPENHVCDEMHSGYDFMPTLLDYLGFKMMRRISFRVRAFAGFDGPGAERRRTVLLYLMSMGPVRMIRSRKYRLVHRYPLAPTSFMIWRWIRGRHITE